MTQRKSLILLTNNYPYSSGDFSFVQGEIKSMARAFEQVFVMPIGPTQVSQMAEMPDNVQLIDSGLPREFSVGIIIRAVLGAGFPRFASLIFKEVWQSRTRIKIPRLVRSAAVASIGGRQLNRLIGTLRKRGDAVAVYSFWGTDCAFPILGARRIPDFCAVRFHGYDLYEERVGYLPFRRPLFEKADVLLPVSSSGLRYLRDRYMGVFAMPEIKLSRLGTMDYGHGPGFPEGSIRVVSCSSIIPLKRVELIFQVLRELSKHYSVDWVHFGDGPGRSELERKIQSVPSTLRVTLRGQITNREILEFYRDNQVSVFVNLSTTEGVPVSIMEAMSFGIPVLATDVGGTGELVGQEFKSGILVHPDAAVVTIVNSLLSLISNQREYNPRKIWELHSNSVVNGDALARFISSKLHL